MQIFYINEANEYIGSGDGSIPPTAFIEVPNPPKDGRSKWNGSSWDEYPVTKEEEIKAELVKQGFTLEERISALEALIMKNDSTKADQIQAIKDLEK